MLSQFTWIIQGSAEALDLGPPLWFSVNVQLVMESGNTDHRLYLARTREQKALHDDKEDVECGRNMTWEHYNHDHVMPCSPV